MQKWVYFVHTYPNFNSSEDKITEEWLNKNGERGWELVNAIVLPNTYGSIQTPNASMYGSITTGEISTNLNVKFIFKRLKE